MNKKNKFVDEAMADINKVAGSEDSTFTIMLSDEQIQTAKRLQDVLSLSKDVFFNMLASYGAYCCSQANFNEDDFPKSMSGTLVSFNISTKSETALGEHHQLNDKFITIFGLNKMSQKLLCQS